MRLTLLILMAFSLLFLPGCRKSDEVSPSPPGLDEIVADLNASFNVLNRDLSNQVEFVRGHLSDTAAIRAALLNMCSRSTFAFEFAYITPEGQLQIAEPAVYHHLQGTDVSTATHIVRSFQSLQPVLSNAYDIAGGYGTAAIVHPVVEDSTAIGGVFTLFRPKTILARIIEPYIHSTWFEIMVIETGGTVLYDQDYDEIGRNVFADSLYLQFPEFQKAARQIESQPRGDVSYRFYSAGKTIPVYRHAWWRSFNLYGTEWKVLWTMQEQ